MVIHNMAGWSDCRERRECPVPLIFVLVGFSPTPVLSLEWESTPPWHPPFPAYLPLTQKLIGYSAPQLSSFALDSQIKALLLLF